MMRLAAPALDFEATLDECINGISGNSDLKTRFVNQRNDLINIGRDYISAGTAGSLYTITPVSTELLPDPFVVGAIKKSELVNLYDYYFRNESKKSRHTYDQLLNSAQEKCPFCGGIGTPRNLDHFLPKAHFPQFSILPENLVPSCRDCNMDGKSHAFATSASGQLIQPYLDHERFFENQWIFANYVEVNPGVPRVIRYYVNPPNNWSSTDKDRVNQHFSDFDLAKRYSVKAAQLLGTVIRQINMMNFRGVTNRAIRTDLLEPGIDEAPFVNHWQRGLYQALHDSLR